MCIRDRIKTGDLYGADFCYKKLPNKLDLFDVETYQKNPMEFYVVATDINTGKPVYHLCPDGDERDIEWYRASASMPLVSRIVKIDGIELLDGGIADAIPIHKFQEMGFEKNIVVLTQQNGYRKKKSSAIPLIRLQSGKKYPYLVQAMEQRHIMYNQTLDEMCIRDSNGSYRLTVERLKRTFLEEIRYINNLQRISQIRFIRSVFQHCFLITDNRERCFRHLIALWCKLLKSVCQDFFTYSEYILLSGKTHLEI